MSKKARRENRPIPRDLVGGAVHAKSNAPTEHSRGLTFQEEIEQEKDAILQQRADYGREVAERLGLDVEPRIIPARDRNGQAADRLTADAGAAGTWNSLYHRGGKQNYDKVQVCPRCRGYIPSNAQPGAYEGAWSRPYRAEEADSEEHTMVCSACGQDEMRMGRNYENMSKEHWPVRTGQCSFDMFS